MVKEWQAITFLKNERKGVSFLKQYRFLISKTDVLEHVHEGNFWAGPPPKITGAHNPDIFKMLDTNGDNLWKWANEINQDNPVNVKYYRGYAQGKVQRQIGTRNAKKFSTLWKRFDEDIVKNRQRINEEMTLVLSNKKFSERRVRRNRNGVVIGRSDIYHGKASDGMIIEIVFEHGSVINLKTIYPIF